MNHNMRIFLAGIIGVIIFVFPICIVSPINGILLASCIAALIATVSVTTSLYLAANCKSGMFVTTVGLTVIVWRYAVFNVLYSVAVLISYYSGKWQMPFVWFVFGHIILACITAWKLLAADAGKEQIEKKDIMIKNRISNWKQLQIKTSELASKANGDVKKYIESVNDAVRYADPVTDDQLVDIELEIKENISLLSKAIDGGDKECIRQISETILLQIKQRSEICKMLK